MPFDREEIYTPGPDPKLEMRFNNGNNVTLTGDRALANASEASSWQAANPTQAALMKYREGDVRETLPYRLGNMGRRFAFDPEPTLYGRIMNQGPIAGGALGAGTGLLAGLLGGWLKQKITGSGSPSNWGAVGALAGGALGALSGHIRKDASTKSAAMYRDPRNFILEKLQSATDVSFSEKAKLAAAVHKLDYNTAQRLADAVRAAVGFGVGALISKFIFGASGSGVLFGGLAGVLGSALLSQITGGPSSSPLLLGSKPITYY